MADIISLGEEVVFHRMDQRNADFLVQNCPQGAQRIEITHQLMALTWEPPARWLAVS
jgi:hypothetical protein